MPGLRIWGAATFAGVLIFTASGPFGTGALPLATRLFFWSALLGLNSLLWICWFAALVRSPGGWWRAAMLGALVLNLLLPLEVSGLLALLGASLSRPLPLIYLDAAALSAALFLLLFVVIGRRRATRSNAKGKLWRAGFRGPNAVAAVSAEDHYCRVWRADGSNSLIHARFADLVDELAGEDGAVLRRGQWVSAAAVRAIRRSDRRWVVDLQDGRSVPVSSGAVPLLRERGWLAARSAA